MNALKRLKDSVRRVDVAELAKALADLKHNANRYGYAALTALTSALELSVEKCSVEMVNLLLDSGADPNAKNDLGENFLHLSVKSGDVQLVQISLLHVKNVNLLTASKLTALDIASDRKYFAIIEILLEHGARAARGFTAHSNCSAIFHGAIQKNMARLMDLLLLQRVNVNTLNELDQTPLHVAVVREKPSLVQTLLDHEAKVNTFDYNSESPLHAAVRNKNVELVKILLSHGADPNLRKSDNAITAFQNSFHYFDSSVVGLLLDHGADASVTSYAGENVLHFAVKCGSVEITDRVLKMKSLDVDAMCEMGNTAFHKLCDAEFNVETQVNIAGLLLKHGADPNAINNYGVNVLHAAATRISVELVEILLKLNVFDVNQPNFHGETALHLLFGKTKHSKRQLAIADSLIENGANVNAKSTNSAPIHYAVLNQNYEAVKFLLSAGAGINYLYAEKYTSLLLAVTVKNEKMCDYLIDHGAKLFCEQEDQNELLQSYIYKWAGKPKYMNLLKMVMVLGADFDGFIPNAELFQQEINTMKETKICPDFDLTYHSLLTKTKHSLVRYLRRQEISNKLESESYKELFPNFYEIIKSKHSRALDRLIWLIDVQKVIYEDFEIMLPFDAMVKVNDYIFE